MSEVRSAENVASAARRFRATPAQLRRVLPVESEVRILMTLLRIGPCRPIDLMGEGLKKSTAYMFLKALTARGELEVVRYEEHERNHSPCPVYQLTTAGRCIAELCVNLVYTRHLAMRKKP